MELLQLLTSNGPPVAVVGAMVALASQLEQLATTSRLRRRASFWADQSEKTADKPEKAAYSALSRVSLAHLVARELSTSWKQVIYYIEAAFAIIFVAGAWRSQLSGTDQLTETIISIPLGVTMFYQAVVSCAAIFLTRRQIASKFNAEGLLPSIVQTHTVVLIRSSLQSALRLLAAIGSMAPVSGAVAFGAQPFLQQSDWAQPLVYQSIIVVPIGLICLATFVFRVTTLMDDAPMNPVMQKEQHRGNGKPKRKQHAGKRFINQFLSAPIRR